MATELLPNYISGGIKPTDELSFDALLAQARAIFPKTPVLDDDTYKALEKMGAIKRAEYDAKMLIMVKNKPPLSEPLSTEAAENCISVGDAAMLAYAKFTQAATDMQRLATIAYAQGYNYMKCSEEDNELSASRKNEVCIATRNEIKAIDKKKLAELSKERARIEILTNKKVEELAKKTIEK